MTHPGHTTFHFDLQRFTLIILHNSPIENRVTKAEAEPSQLTLTCSKSTKETLEKGVKYVQSQQ